MKRILPVLLLVGSALLVPMSRAQTVYGVMNTSYPPDAFVGTYNKTLNAPYSPLSGMDSGFVLNIQQAGTSTQFAFNDVFTQLATVNQWAGWSFYVGCSAGSNPGTTSNACSRGISPTINTASNGNYGYLGTIASNSANDVNFTGTVSGTSVTGVSTGDIAKLAVNAPLCANICGGAYPSGTIITSLGSTSFTTNNAGTNGTYTNLVAGAVVNISTSGLQYLTPTTGPTSVSNLPTSFAVNDEISVFSPVGQTVPLAFLNQWNLTCSGCTQSVDTTSGNLPPASAAGIVPSQVEQLSVPAGTGAQMNEVIDTSSIANLGPLSGTYSLHAQLKAISGPAVQVCNSSSRNTGITIMSNVCQSTSGTSWATYTNTSGSVSEGTIPNNSVNETWTFNCPSGGAACVFDYFDLGAHQNADTNSSVFTDNLINDYKAMNAPGIRWINIISSWQAGCRPETMMDVQAGRRACNASLESGMTSSQGTPSSLMEQLQGCAAVSALECDVTLPVWWPPNYYKEIVDGFACNSGTTFGAMCANQGLTDWRAKFKKIHVNVGNEPWNYTGGNSGVTILPAQNILPMASLACQAMKSSSSWTTTPQVMECGGSIQQQGGIAPSILSTVDPSGYVDTVSTSMYAAQQPATGNLTPAAIYNAILAEYMGLWLSDSSSNINQAFSSGKVDVYEGAGPSNCGSGCTATNMQGIDEGGGEAVARAMVLMAIQHKYQTGAPHAIADFEMVGLNTTTNVLVNLWGSVQQSGGNNVQKRPRFWTESVANACMALGYQPTGSIFTSTPNTFNFAGYNGVPAESNVPKQLQILYANAAGSPTQYCVALVNADPTNSFTFSWSGATSPASATSVTTAIVTSPAINTTNESSQNVAVVAGTLTSPTSVVVAPLSVMTLIYAPGGSGPLHDWFVMNKSALPIGLVAGLKYAYNAFK